MASTGILFRRDLKEELIIDPPLIGEIVFATDTEEYGMIDKDSNILWRKLFVSDTYFVNTTLERDALTPEAGDICFVQDIGEIYFFNDTWEVFNIDYIKNITNSQNFITSDESTRGTAALTLNATSVATPNTLVSRNAQGQFYGTLKGTADHSLTSENADHATNADDSLRALDSQRSVSAELAQDSLVARKLKNAVYINSTKFDGSANITVYDSTKVAISDKGIAGGVVPLDAFGKISSTYLPSYVDDVLEFSDLASFPASGETSKIYVDKNTNKTYRWSGSAYIYITSGAVDSVAGKTGVVILTKNDVGLNEVDNTTDLNKPISSDTQAALNLKANANIGSSSIVVVTNESGVIVPSTITSTELSYLSGLTSSIKSQFESVQSSLTFDSTPTEGSSNPVTSDGIFNALNSIDALPSQTGNAGKYLSTNGTSASWEEVASGIVYTKSEIQNNIPKFGLDMTNTTPPSAGQIAWNIDERTADLGLNGVTLQIGQETLMYVRNTSGSTITNKTVCKATGTIGNSGRITISPYNLEEPKYLLGIATEDIPDGADGYVTVFGKVRGIDTSMFAEGDILYAAASGALTNVAPVTPAIKLPIAIVITSHSNGTLFVRATTFDENERALTSHAHGDISTTGTITSAAITPANADYILLSDTSASGKIQRGIALGSDTTTFLRNDGTWQTASIAYGDISTTGTITSAAITPANADYILLSDTSASGKIQKGIALGSDTTTFLRNDGTWQTITGGATISNDIATNSTFYPTFTSITSGTMTAASVSNTKLTFNPSTGNLSSTTFTSLSDINLKENIENIDDALTVLSSMRPVTFSWKDGSGDSSGFIAQELELILPDSVQESDGVKSVNYDSIIAYLVKGIQELKQEISVLKQSLLYK